MDTKGTVLCHHYAECRILLEFDQLRQFAMIYYNFHHHACLSSGLAVAIRCLFLVFLFDYLLICVFMCVFITFMVCEEQGTAPPSGLIQKRCCCGSSGKVGVCTGFCVWFAVPKERST